MMPWGSQWVTREPILQREAGEMKQEKDGAMTLETGLSSHLSHVSNFCHWHRHQFLLWPWIYVQRVQKNAFLKESFLWISPPLMFNSAWEGEKTRSAHGETLHALFCCRLSLFFSHKHTRVDMNAHTHTVWCVWNMKSLFQGNPSDICFSHYHNNWHSTAQSKSLADWDRIITREEKRGGTLQKISIITSLTFSHDSHKLEKMYAHRATVILFDSSQDFVKKCVKMIHNKSRYIHNKCSVQNLLETNKGAYCQRISFSYLFN